jgi:hypothetical protein
VSPGTPCSPSAPCGMPKAKRTKVPSKVATTVAGWPGASVVTESVDGEARERRAGRAHRAGGTLHAVVAAREAAIELHRRALRQAQDLRPSKEVEAVAGRPGSSVVARRTRRWCPPILCLHEEVEGERKRRGRTISARSAVWPRVRWASRPPRPASRRRVRTSDEDGIANHAPSTFDHAGGTPAWAGGTPTLPETICTACGGAWLSQIALLFFSFSFRLPRHV